MCAHVSVFFTHPQQRVELSLTWTLTLNPQPLSPYLSATGAHALDTVPPFKKLIGILGVTRVASPTTQDKRHGVAGITVTCNTTLCWQFRICPGFDAHRWWARGRSTCTYAPDRSRRTANSAHFSAACRRGGHNKSVTRGVISSNYETRLPHASYPVPHGWTLPSVIGHP
jgi:hypothetical protein